MICLSGLKSVISKSDKTIENTTVNWLLIYKKILGIGEISWNISYQPCENVCLPNFRRLTGMLAVGKGLLLDADNLPSAVYLSPVQIQPPSNNGHFFLAAPAWNASVELICAAQGKLSKEESEVECLCLLV